MGIEIFTKSGKFNPRAFGLKVGQALQVIVMGGGGGGGEGGEPVVLFTLYNNSTAMCTKKFIGSEIANYTPSNTGHDLTFPGSSGTGGTSGEILFKTISLNSLDELDIIIGNGGSVGIDGSPSSFGSYITARGGKAGVKGAHYSGVVGNNVKVSDVKTHSTPNTIREIIDWVYKLGLNGKGIGPYTVSSVTNTLANKASEGGQGGGGWRLEYTGTDLLFNDITLFNEKLIGFGQGGKGSPGKEIIKNASNKYIIGTPDTSICNGKPGVVIVTW